MIDSKIKNTTPTAVDLVMAASNELRKNGNALARRDADLILAHILEIEPAHISLFSDPIPADKLALFEEMVDRRLTGEPVAYIVGEQGFWTLDFYVNKHTLIPRPDTELLVEIGLKAIEGITKPRIADLGTGSGCILLSILSESGTSTGVGVDVSPDALDIARRNAERHGLNARAQFIQSDWFEGLAGEKFDLIVSNPPYIPAEDIAGLMSDVRDFEPASALNGGQDGLDYYRQISSHANRFLMENGYLAFEVGIGQFADVSSIMEDCGYTDIQVFPDLAGVNRAIIGKKPKES